MVPGTGTACPPGPPDPPDTPVARYRPEGELSVRPHPINKGEVLQAAVMPAERRKKLQVAVAHRMTIGGTFLAVIFIALYHSDPGCLLMRLSTTALEA